MGKHYELGGIRSADDKIIQIPYDIFYLAGLGYKNVLENMKSSEEEVKGLNSLIRHLEIFARNLKQPETQPGTWKQDLLEHIS